MQILSTFAAVPVEKEVKKLLGVPHNLKVAYGIRLGYPAEEAKYMRVRRNLEDFVHHNKMWNQRSLNFLS